MMMKIMMMMNPVLYLLLLLLLMGTNNKNGGGQVVVDAYNFHMVTGGSDFFEQIEAGFLKACDDNPDITECNVTEPRDPVGPSVEWLAEHGHVCTHAIRQLIKRGDVDGITSFCGAYIEPAIFEEVRDAGIEMVVFDQPVPEEDYKEPTPSAFIGTDNIFLGRTMARLLRQLRPEGGVYAFNYRFGDVTQEARIKGFEEEIQKDNYREDRAHWFRSTENVTWLDAQERMGQIEILVERDPNLTAIIFPFQSPMRAGNYSETVGKIKLTRNITFIGTDGNDYQLAYLNQRFVDGLVGQLTWEMGTKSAETLYDLVQKRLAGNGDTLFDYTFIPTNLVAYNLIPLELPGLTVEQNLLGNLVIIGYVCFGIVVIGTIISIIWTICNRNDVVVRAAQPFFLMMTATGVLIMSGSLIPLSFDDAGVEMTEFRSVAICMSIPWLAFTGFTVTFSALFSKTWRINQFFKQRTRFGRIMVSEMDVLKPFALLFTCNIIILVCWTVIDPLRYQRIFGDGTDFWNREIESYGSCNSQHVARYITPLAVVNAGVLGLACWQAFEARDIQSEFSEATYIGLAVFSLTQAVISGVPLVVVVQDIPQAFYLVTTFFIFIVCMAVLLLIFLPKMFMQRSYARMSPRDQRKMMAMSIRKSAKSENRSDAMSAHTINNNDNPGFGAASGVFTLAARGQLPDSSSGNNGRDDSNSNSGVTASGHRQRGQMVAYSEVELLRAENKQMENEIEKLKRELVSDGMNGVREEHEEDGTGRTKNSDGDEDDTGRPRIASKMKSEEEIAAPPEQPSFNSKEESAESSGQEKGGEPPEPRNPPPSSIISTNTITA